MDVIEGRILCDADQAVLLASYSMQGTKFNIKILNKFFNYLFFHICIAEFGDHDLEKHTSEYLKDFALFPKVIVLFVYLTFLFNF